MILLGGGGDSSVSTESSSWQFFNLLKCQVLPNQETLHFLIPFSLGKCSHHFESCLVFISLNHLNWLPNPCLLLYFIIICYRTVSTIGLRNISIIPSQHIFTSDSSYYLFVFFSYLDSDVLCDLISIPYQFHQCCCYFSYRYGRSSNNVVLFDIVLL